MAHALFQRLADAVHVDEKGHEANALPLGVLEHLSHHKDPLLLVDEGAVVVDLGDRVVRAQGVFLRGFAQNVLVLVGQGIVGDDGALLPHEPDVGKQRIARQ